VSWTSRPRFAARARTRRWLAVRPLLLVCLVLAAVVTLGWVAFLSPVLAVSRVEVTGERRLTAADVLGVAHVTHGVPLARVDTGAIRARLEALPAVRAADVRRWPPRTVRITVTERVGAAVVHVRGGYRLVDEEGVLFARSSVRPGGLPLIEAGEAGATSRTLARAAAVLRALPPGIEKRVTAVHADSPDAISLSLRGGTRVVWGGPEQSAFKAEVLGALMRHEATVYDVSAPDAPVTRG